MRVSPAHELAALVDAMRAAASAAQPAALATLTATRGAAFRRAGTRMLVHADGRVVCALSGGCPQRDIVARAQRVIADGRPQLARYNADTGMDVLMEMGCGGELDVLIEPLADARTLAFFEAVDACLGERHDVMAATLFARNGAVVAPRHALWRQGGLRFDDFDDDALRSQVEDAIGSARAARAVTRRLGPAAAAADVLLEHIDPPHALFVIGSNATARALLSVGQALGWQLTLVDADAARLHEAALPPATRAVRATPQSVPDAFVLDTCSSVVLVTHNLDQDLAWLRALAGAPVAYFGAVCSRDRAQRLASSLSHIPEYLHVPAGLDIGSDTPGEIAVAIAAEIIAVLNDRSGGPLRDGDGALHA